MSTVSCPPAADKMEIENKLPYSGLLALALLGFIAILTETLPAGLLPQIGATLGVRDELTGQLVTAYALGSMIAAIPGAVLTRTWRRRKVLLTAVGGFLVFNAVTAISSNYALTLAARFFAGVAAGITWGLVPVYARQMVPAGQQGRAMAVALVGTPLALSLGVPAGTWLGSLVNWRIPFEAMSLVAMGLIGWITISVPDFPGQQGHAGSSVFNVLLAPGIRPILSVVLAWMLGHNLLYTYIAPYLRYTGTEGNVATVLFAFGGGALAGIALVGYFIDRYLRYLLLVSLSAFAVTAVVLMFGQWWVHAIVPAALIWGLTFGGAATLLQTASADTAGADAGIAQSLIVTVWNAAIAGGGLLGGALLKYFGAESFSPAVLVFALIGVVVVAVSRCHGFRAGRRALS